MKSTAGMERRGGCGLNVKILSNQILFWEWVDF